VGRRQDGGVGSGLESSVGLGMRNHWEKAETKGSVGLQAEEEGMMA
jgi:hypothetical protein